MSALAEGVAPHREQRRSRATETKENNFNFLRLVFATLVILGHSFELKDGDRHRELLYRVFGVGSLGGFAVSGFFALSGYLIVKSWMRDPSSRDFFVKRVLRIYPGFLVASIVSIFVVGPLGADVHQYFAHLSMRSVAGNSVFLMSPVVPAVFQGQPHPELNGSMWTIAYEFRCYLLVALLGVCMVLRRIWPWLLLTGGVLLAATLPLTVALPTFKPARLLLGNPTMMFPLLACFSAGGCYYLLRDRVTFDKRWAVGALGLMIAGMFNERTLPVALSVFGSYALFTFAFIPIPALKRFQTTSDISYGVYLYAWPVQKLLLWYLPDLNPWTLFFLATGGAYSAGYVSWHLVERRFLRMKPHPTGPVPAAG